MKKFLIGTKQQMTQVFDETGRVWPATVIAVSPMTVTQLKTKDADGYEAVQVGHGTQKKERVNRAQQSKGTFAGYKEFRPQDMSGYSVGDAIDASIFEPGEIVQVAGTSKGKGFQGVVKRHGFHGGPRTHGQKHSEREPGSIGIGGVQRVMKGMRMAGRMGNDRVTVKNLRILQVDAENGVVLVSGAVPGRRGTVVEITGNGKKKGNS